MIIPTLYYLWLAWIALVAAQTVTITNPAGQTIVQEVTTDLALGPSTRIISTISAPPAPTSPRTLTDQVVPTRNPGPVGAPPSTSGTPGGPTPYTYQTVVDGRTAWVVDVFTPTRIATTPVSNTGTGSIMDYSAFLTSFGTGVPSQPNSSTTLLPAMSVTILLMISTVFCILV